MGNTNYINAEIYIKEEDINKNIRIINSFDNYKKKVDLRMRKLIIKMQMKKK